MTFFLGAVLGVCVGFVAGGLYVWRRVTRYYLVLRTYNRREMTDEMIADLMARDMGARR